MRTLEEVIQLWDSYEYKDSPAIRIEIKGFIKELKEALEAEKFEGLLKKTEDPWGEKPDRVGYPRPHYQQRAKFYYYPELEIDTFHEKLHLYEMNLHNDIAELKTQVDELDAEIQELTVKAERWDKYTLNGQNITPEIIEAIEEAEAKLEAIKIWLKDTPDTLSPNLMKEWWEKCPIKIMEAP